MKYLLCRFGGIGDTIIITVVAKAIKRRDPNHIVHAAVWDKHVDLLRHCRYVDQTLEMRRMMPGNVHCIKHRFGWASVDCVMPDYDMPIEFRFSVEGNSMNRHRASMVGEWMSSQNSNYQNWIDLSLAWANIDPTTVDDKTPEYTIEDGEERWAEEQVGYLKPLLAMNMTASSQNRTRPDSQELVRPLLEAFPDYTVLWWNNDEETWYKWNKNGMQPFGARINLRQSVALLAQCDVLVAMDSGLSHMAECISSAIGLTTVCFYTTVPGWTRAMYFPQCHAVDVALPCSPCFSLHNLCPENRRAALEQLSVEERYTLDAAVGRISLDAACSELGLARQELIANAQAIEARLMSIAQKVPKCVKQITPEIIIERVRVALDRKPQTTAVQMTA